MSNLSENRIEVFFMAELRRDLMDPDSLQEICFSHIVMTLEQFTTDQLSLLPVKFKNDLLLSLPLVDVCRLEDSQFTAELDMEAVWKQICTKSSRLRAIAPQKPQKYWKEDILQYLLNLTLKAPHGLRRVRTCTGGVNISTSRNALVRGHPILNKINYLVMVLNQRKRIPRCTCRRYSALNRDEVARVGSSGAQVVPSARARVEVCQARRCIPPRYESLLPEGSCHLPEEAAFKLICNVCRFYPKELNFSISELSKFFVGVEEAKDYFIPLTEFFKNVEKLTIRGETSIVCGRNMHGADMFYDDIPSTLLRLILNHSHPKLDTLTITGVSTSVIDLSVSTILASSYSGLKALTLSPTDVAKCLFNLQVLIPMIERQSSLRTISLAYCCDDIPQFSHVHAWLSLCLEKPSLQHFNLSYSFMSKTSDFFLEILMLFLSTPCSYKQTLTLTNKHPVRRRRHHYSASTDRKLSQLSKKPPSTVCTSTPKLPRFDDTLTLQYKSVVLINCLLDASFIDSLLALKSLKLNQLHIEGDHNVSFFKLVVLNDFFVEN